MKKIKLYLSLLISSLIFSCASSNDEKVKIQQQEDSVARAEAEALDQEAAVAQHMIDSAIAVEKSDSIKQAEIKKATQQ
jgi:PBP1b-binding outer membrane lipoprotein LpoB